MEPSILLQRYFLPLLYLVNILGLAARPSICRTLMTLPIIVLLLLQLPLRQDRGNFGDDYSSGCTALTLAFTYLDWIVLANPDKEKWHKIRDRRNAKGKQDRNIAVPSSFVQRLWWAARLMIYVRGTGWSHQSKNVPEGHPANYPKLKFAVRKTFRAVFFFFVQDTACAYTASTPYGTYRGIEKTPVGFLSAPFMTQFLLCWVHITITYSLLELINCVVGVISVLSGLAPPNECPRLFGDLRGAYTVRRSWSATWHQMMRRVCSMSGIFLARDVFHLAKGTFASKYLQLFVGFLASGIIHSGASAANARSFVDNGEISFFLAQAVIILIEDHIIEFGRKLGARDSWIWRILGYLWIITWFGYSLRPWVSGGASKGIWVHRRSVDIFGIGPQD
ncbi:hypothetical protein AOQ84DRAFT_105058 [Glonium stellatum]|uniref:Wax synthase domain-containing protein n=1 Tax=Glonium stellatum TaxID=574774 RepID=A0A8E2JPV6_9PEZI|nr:hypothetical protein AOQ84DRAFT_105058 [Glonium stellatum]